MDLASKLRQFVITGLRVTALALLLIAFFDLPAVIQQGVRSVRAYPGYRLEHYIEAGGISTLLNLLAIAGAGLFLAVFARRLTCWLVPRIATGAASTCLRCGHALDAANAGTCPECGTRA